MVSRRVLAAFFLGVVILLQPIYGVGPGLNTQYTYDTTTIDLSDNESVGKMHQLPVTEYGTGVQLDATREAANTTVTYPDSDVPPDLRTLLDFRILADDFEDQYYRIDARITDGTYRLDATPVTANTVADELAIAPETAPQPVRAVLDDEMTSRSKAPPTLVEVDDRFVLVQPVDSEQVPDPYTIPKLVAYALALAAILWAVIAARSE